MMCSLRLSSARPFASIVQGLMLTKHEQDRQHHARKISTLVLTVDLRDVPFSINRVFVLLFPNLKSLVIEYRIEKGS